MAPQRLRWPWLLGAGLWLLLATAAGAAEVRNLTWSWEEEVLRVGWELEAGLAQPIRQRIASGIEVEFSFRVELRRQRSSFFDKTVARREVSVSVRYSNLTKMYSLTRRTDGTVTEQDVTERQDEMVRWMTRLEGLPLFARRELDAPGSYYIKLKGKLLDRFKLLLIPADLETGWARSETIQVSGEAGG